MSAQVIAFPSSVRAANERRRSVREAIVERAKTSRATPEQKQKALIVATNIMDGGGSAGWALFQAYAQMPSVATPVYRQPSPPTPPAAA